MLDIKSLTFGYHDDELVLNDVSLQIEQGKRIALLGPSGYGKSTLSKILAGYMLQRSGIVTLDGQDIREIQGYNPIQLIYQHPEKALNPRWKLKKSLDEAWDIPESLLDRMGIEREWLSRWPNELSGGQLQRISILRALSPQTKVLIADEITASLDAITQAQLWSVILEEVDKHNMTLVLITHNRHLANRVCEELVEMNVINN